MVLGVRWSGQDTGTSSQVGDSGSHILPLQGSLGSHGLQPGWPQSLQLPLLSGPGLHPCQHPCLASLPGCRSRGAATLASPCALAI